MSSSILHTLKDARSGNGYVRGYPFFWIVDIRLYLDQSFLVDSYLSQIFLFSFVDFIFNHGFKMDGMWRR